jgi:hypothetical protein
MRLFMHGVRAMQLPYLFSLLKINSKWFGRVILAKPEKQASLKTRVGINGYI